MHKSANEDVKAPSRRVITRSKLSVVLKERFLPDELVWNGGAVRLCGEIIVPDHSPVC